MAWCAAVDCGNSKKKNPDKTFFKLPKEGEVRKAWVAAINRTQLPSLVYLCSDHFTEECFDESWGLQIRLLSQSNNPVKRKLKDGAVPTIFPHKKAAKERSLSKKRENNKIKEEILQGALNEQAANSDNFRINDDDNPMALGEAATDFSFCGNKIDFATQTDRINTDKGVQHRPYHRSVVIQYNSKRQTRHMKTQTRFSNNDFSCQFLSQYTPKTDFSCQWIGDENDVAGEDSDESSFNRGDSSDDYDSDDENDENRNHVTFTSLLDITRFLYSLGFSCSFKSQNGLFKECSCHTEKFTHGVNNSSHEFPANVNISKDLEVDCSDNSETDELDNLNVSYHDNWLDNSNERVENNDPTFEPDTLSETSTCSSSEDGDCDAEITEDFLKPKKCPSQENVFLVYESCLRELFKVCSRCGSNIKQSKIKQKLKTGSQLKVSLSCENGCVYSWSSQPYLSPKISAGNVFIVAAAEFAGIGYSKLLKFANILNLKFLGSTTYYRHRGEYVYPEVQHAWVKNQTEQQKEIKSSGRLLELAADGQCDSPGHNATYNTVTMMDTHTNKVLDFKIVHVSQVTSSNAMEKEGFQKSLDYIREDLTLPVRLVSTDRHISIKKLMKSPKYVDILHQFDAWHVAKNVLKKLLKESKKKDCHVLRRWAHSISNHLYWSISKCKGNGEELAERFTSLIFHCANVHEFPSKKFYKRCEHAPYSEEESKKKEWIEMGSVAHNKLIKIITQPTLTKDLVHMAEQKNTTLLEVFHSKKIRFLPKSIFYQYEKMLAGTQIAALEHNNNINLQQKCSIDDEGNPKPIFTIAYSKPSKRFVAKIVREEKNTSYVDYIFRKIAKRVSQNAKISGKKRRRRQKKFKIAPERNESREQIIANKKKYQRIKL